MRMVVTTWSVHVVSSHNTGTSVCSETAQNTPKYSLVING